MSVAAHPGVANTNLFQAGEFHAIERMVRRGFGVAIGALLNTDAQGAVPTLFAATSPDAADGGYYGPQSWWDRAVGMWGRRRLRRRRWMRRRRRGCGASASG